MLFTLFVIYLIVLVPAVLIVFSALIVAGRMTRALENDPDSDEGRR